MFSATISGFSAKPVAVGRELVADRPVGLRRDRSAGAVDQMEDARAALDVAEEAVAETDAFMRALDQAGNVGEHELAAFDARRRRAWDAAS